MRNLAAYHGNEQHNYPRAAEEILRSSAMLPDSRCIAVDCGSLICSSGDPALIQQFLDFWPRFTEDVRNMPRMQLLRVRALLALNKTEEAIKILTPDFSMPDIKEGELSVSALWDEMYIQHLIKTENIDRDTARQSVKKRYPLPYTLDYRMHE